MPDHLLKRFVLGALVCLTWNATILPMVAQCSCAAEQTVQFKLRGIASMAGSAIVRISYAAEGTNVVTQDVLMTGGIIDGPNGSGEYSVQSFGCVDWGFDVTVEPKIDQPVSIEYIFVDDKTDPAYTEFEAMRELNPAIHWTRPNSSCLKVYFDESDGNWVLEPEVFLSTGPTPIRLKGSVETDDSNAGDSAGLRSGMERPTPDNPEFTIAPAIGDLSGSCPGQAAPMALGAESALGPESVGVTRSSGGGFSSGMKFKPPSVSFDETRVAESDAEMIKVDTRVAGSNKVTAETSSPMALLSASDYSVAAPIGRLHWEMSLGSVDRMLSLGTLNYQAEALDATAYSPGRLSLALGSDPNKIINDTNGVLRQVELKDHLVDIVPMTNGFEIGVYPGDQVGIFDSGTELFPISGVPSLTWMVRNPDATPLGRIRFTKTEGTNTEVHQAEWQGTAGVSGMMEITRHNGKWKDLTEYSLVSTNQRIETVSRYKGTNLQYRVRETYQEFYNWGLAGEVYDAVVERVVDPDGQALTTSFVYWDQPGQPGNELFSTSSYHGYTEQIPSRISGGGFAPVASSGDPLLIRQPYRDQDAVATGARVTRKSYTQFSGQELLEQTQTTINDQLVGVRETYHDFTADGYWGRITAEYLDESGMYTMEEEWLKVGNRRTVFTVDRQGRTKNFLHTPGFWDPVSDTFSQTSGTGTVQALKTTVVNGVLATQQGIADETTVDVTVEDQVGRVLAEEIYVSSGNWENTTALIDRRVHAYTDGRLTLTRQNGRVTYEAGYFPDGKLQWEEGETGQRTIYSYDEMNRVFQRTTVGRGNDADQVITYDYDVLGRVTSEVRTAGGLQVGTRSIYNLAGELTAIVGIDGLTNVVATTYAGGTRMLTETLPTLATRVVSYFKDGTPRSVTGTAVEDEFYDPQTLQWTPGTYREGLAVYRDSTLTRLKHLRLVNWLGAEILLRTPQFKATGNRDRYTYYDFDLNGQSRGLVEFVSETGRATTLFTYDDLSRLSAQGRDLNANGMLDAASLEPLNTFEYGYANHAGVWESFATVGRYVEDNLDTNTVVLRTRRIVPAALSANLLSSNIVERIGGGVVVTAVAVDRTSGDLVTTVQDQELGQTRTSLARDGRVRWEIRSGLATNAFNYTALGELETVINPITGNVTYSFEAETRRLAVVTDSLNRTTTYAYYPAGVAHAGRVKGVQDALGNWTYFDYSEAGQLFRRWGVNTYPIEQRHDEAGRMTNLMTFRTSETAINWALPTWPDPPAGDVTTWVYDEPSGLLERTIDADAGTGARSVIHSYDSGNYPDTKVNGRGQTIDYRFSALGQLTNVVYSDETPAVSMSYDRVGRLRAVTDALGTRALTWTDRDQSEGETYESGLMAGLSVERTYDTQHRFERLELKQSGATQTRQRFAYDGISRLDYVADETPDGATELHRFDYGFKPDTGFVNSIGFSQAGNAVMTQTYSRDSLGRLAGAGAVLAGGGTVYGVDYQFDDLNRRMAADLTDGTKWDFGYDDRSQLTSGRKKFDSGAFEGGKQFGYAFDDIGNRTQTKTGGDAVGASLREANYLVNARNELTQREVSGSVWLTGEAPTNMVLQGVANEYGFALERQEGERYFGEAVVDNRATPVFGRITVAGTTNGVLTDVETGEYFVPGNPEEFVYDDDGNLTWDGRWVYVWDAENRLVSVTARNDVPDAAKRRMEFLYDYLGRRIQKVASTWNGFQYVAEFTNRFIYDGWNLMAILAPDSSLLKSFTWGPDLSGMGQGAGGVGGLLMIKAGTNGQHYAVYDGNGNLTTLVDSASGNVTAHYEYGPFGETIRVTGPMAKLNPFRFSTKFTDDETGLLYYGHRYYSPGTGRWISKDPIGVSGGLNLYGFVGGNPISGVDYLGRAGYFFDGTGNHPHERNLDGSINYKTNVRIMFESYAPSNGRRHYAYGIGTGYSAGGTPYDHVIFHPWFLSHVVRAEAATGDTLSARVDWMIKNLEQELQAGDPMVDVFGFSRGSAEALLFLNRIAAKKCEDNDPLYKDLKIRFVGLFDAVTSLRSKPKLAVPNFEIESGEASGFEFGIPENLTYLNEPIHFIALDEQRAEFQMLDLQGARQIGFRGVHSDIGAGYGPENPFSWYTLRNMLEYAGTAGVGFNTTRLSELTESPVGNVFTRRLRIDAQPTENSKLYFNDNEQRIFPSNMVLHPSVNNYVTPRVNFGY